MAALVIRDRDDAVTEKAQRGTPPRAADLPE